MRIFGNPRRLARRVSHEAATTALAVIMGLGGWLFGPVPGAAATTVTVAATGVAAWRADRIDGHPLPDPQTASPVQVARFFAALDPAARTGLTRQYPAVVGNLDGAPLALRYAANAEAAGPAVASAAGPAVG